jgi:hypothetical protein
LSFVFSFSNDKVNMSVLLFLQIVLLVAGKVAYFNARDIAGIAMCAALWGVINSIFAPVFFSIFHVPFFCDMIGFAVLILAAWWIRKPGAITIIGVIATLINFALVANPYHFLGFTAASIFFDFALAISGLGKLFDKKSGTIASIMAISIISAAIAGYIIGTFFMAGAIACCNGGEFLDGQDCTP